MKGEKLKASEDLITTPRAEIIDPLFQMRLGVRELFCAGVFLLSTIFN